MPALLPPSMQIGGLPQGYSPLPPNGPTKSGISTPALPVFVQSSGFVTTISGPTNISQTVTATRQGTYLVWAVAVNASAAAALGGTPTGWTLQQSQSTATLATAIYIYPRNPGGITAVTFSSNATATTGGIASWFWEVDNAFSATVTGTSANGSSAAPASGNITPATDATIQLGMVAWVLGTATLSAPTGGWTTTNAQQSSTGGTTNAALETFSQVGVFGTPGTVAMGATLSASAVWVAGLLATPTTISGQVLIESPGGQGNFRADQGAGYASGGSLQGALGGTKPGGAGSGQ